MTSDNREYKVSRLRVHSVSDQYLAAYANAWDEWLEQGQPNFFLDWIIENYGVKYTVSSRKLVDVSILDDRKHILFLLKHSDPKYLIKLQNSS